MKFDKEEEKAEPKGGDPQESMMNMMKKLYQEGDDEMKKTIAQAWVKRLKILLLKFDFLDQIARGKRQERKNLNKN